MPDRCGILAGRHRIYRRGLLLALILAWLSHMAILQTYFTLRDLQLEHVRRYALDSRCLCLFDEDDDAGVEAGMLERLLMTTKMVQWSLHGINQADMRIM